MRVAIMLFVLLVAGAASAAADESAPFLFPEKPRAIWHIDWTSPDTAPPALGAAAAHAIAAESAQTSAPPRVAIEYSHGYQVRAKIHRYASYAMLPLFATEFALGQSLYDDPGGSRQGAHAAVGAGIGALFGVNTVTGAWNLWEARKDPAHRGRRLAHGLLMMAADAGFLATAASAPDVEHGSFLDDRRTHRTIALTSIGLATAGYLTMLFGGK